MNNLEQIVLPLKESQELEAAGIHLNTAFAYYPKGCGAYPFDENGVTLPECRKYLGEPVPCLCDEMEDHAFVCSAPVLSELLDEVEKEIDELEKKLDEHVEWERSYTYFNHTICYILTICDYSDADNKDNFTYGQGIGKTDILAIASLLKNMQLFL